MPHRPAPPQAALVRSRTVPPRALLLSVAALAIPVLATNMLPEWVDGEGALLTWLPVLVPAFLLTYHRGWEGGSLALAAGMATLTLTQVEVLLLELPTPAWPYIAAIVVVLVMVSLGAGWVTELLHRERERVEVTAFTDPLTGLPNRRHAASFLSNAWGAAQRGRDVAVVLFDLDRFKLVNDRHGHHEGDHVLTEFAKALLQRTRRMDLSARFGGEEFLAILVDCNIEQAYAFAEDIRQKTSEFDFGWGQITVSAGVSAVEEGMGSPDVLIAAADRALYAAKDQGRNRVVRADMPVGSMIAPPPSPVDLVPTPRSDLEGACILLVDDEDASLQSMAHLIRRFGCSVIPAGSAREALRIVMRDQHLDMLVTDVVMPDMSGFTLVDLVAKVRPALPVLYVSGYPQEEAYWGGTPGARSSFLGKPFEIDALRSKMLMLLDPHRSHRRGRSTEDVPRRSATKRSTEGPETGTTRRPGRLLIVDDNEAVVKSLQRLFIRSGYDPPVGVSDPTMLTELLWDQDFDLMILDLNMPGMDGFDVLDTLNTIIDPEDYFPVLILTGDEDPSLRRRALAAGAMDFLNKPFDPLEADARVRNLLETRFLTRRVLAERNNLEERVSERTAELADTRSELLHRLARAAEYRDDITGRHAERVGLLSSTLAAELGLPPREADLLRRTAPLHDIGKIGIPDAILRKPGRLTPTEFELMKTHTTIGAQILGGSHHRVLGLAKDIALCHHERWDGGGYPHGLAREEIPMEARVVTVVDAFDTMAHDRPYKAARPAYESLEEIIRGRGRRYDPDVVDAFLSVSDRVGPDQLFELGDPLDPLRDTNLRTP